MITVEDIEGLFDRARQHRAEGRAKWNVDDVCRWSFFFVDDNREKLLRAAEALRREGYEPRGLLEPSADDDDKDKLFVRVDRIEKHTIASLLARNDELYAFAKRFGLEYDGMDVGAVEGS